jgi:Na+/melibiose symporter-like transporter
MRVWTGRFVIAACLASTIAFAQQTRMGAEFWMVVTIAIVTSNFWRWLTYRRTRARLRAHRAQKKRSDAA